jgi:N-methylhydantoinase B
MSAVELELPVRTQKRHVARAGEMTVESALSNSATASDAPVVDMFTMVVLRRRFEAIIGDMVNALFKSGRSGVLNTAKDFTCSVVDSKLQTVSAAVGGLPVHASAIDLIPRAIKEKFGDDLYPGDCFANNSGYHGNTHCGDFTLCAPVFFDGKVIFYAIARDRLPDPHHLWTAGARRL